MPLHDERWPVIRDVQDVLAATNSLPNNLTGNGQ